MARRGAGRAVEAPSGQSSTRPAGLRVAATVLTVAGAVWWVVGTSAGVTAAAAWPWWLLGAAVVGALLVLGRRRLDDRGERELFERRRRTYTVVNLVQGVLIAVVVALCLALGEPAWIAPGITFVVAVHFLPLATAFEWAGYRHLAGVLALVAAGGAGAAASGVDAQVVQRGVMTAVAVVLWAAVVAAVLTRPAVRAGADVPA